MFHRAKRILKMATLNFFRKISYKKIVISSHFSRPIIAIWSVRRAADLVIRIIIIQLMEWPAGRPSHSPSRQTVTHRLYPYPYVVYLLRLKI